MSSSDDVRSHWPLDPDVTFLNHGSFGACPETVLAAQEVLRRRLERQPVQFMMRELEPALDAARSEMAAFVGAEPEDLVFVPNATTGVNSVLRSYPLREGDELLTTDHAYNACRNTLDWVAERSGARVVVVPIPFPVEDSQQIVDAILSRATDATRLALLDHITSPTGFVLPLESIVQGLRERGVESLVDGAHAPGMIDLDVSATGAAYYTGNCHKWICAPKGAAFLWVRRDRQGHVRPVTISHGANATRSDRSRFLLEFDWVGTQDPTAYLTVPEALRFMGSLFDGGWPEVRRRNHELALRGRDILCAALDVPAPVPDDMLGSLAAVPLPPGSGQPPTSQLYTDPLQGELLQREGIEVPIIPWPKHPQRLVRISAQLYNDESQYEKLARALLDSLAAERA